MIIIVVFIFSTESYVSYDREIVMVSLFINLSVNFSYILLAIPRAHTFLDVFFLIISVP